MMIRRKGEAKARQQQQLRMFTILKFAIAKYIRSKNKSWETNE